MVHHIVCWNFKEELSEEERIAAGNTIKEKTGIHTELCGRRHFHSGENQ